MNHKLLITGATLMGLAVILGALGAHALEKHLSPDILQSFETGVRYQIFHALGLIILSTVFNQLHPSRMRWAIRLMLIGIICFSGSIYSFALGHLLNISIASVLWWVTPLGGLLLIAAWAVLISAAIPGNKPV